MKGYWDHLRPLEKRLVVGVGTVLFIVLNAWFVVPHFSDWGRVKVRMAKAQETLLMFQTNIAQKTLIDERVKKLASEGLDVPQEDQTVHFDNAILSQEAQLGITPGSSGRITSKPTQFFVELSKNLSIQCKEQQLVDFLYNLGSGNSLIRVRGLTLQADTSHQQLAANITLVASYQKKPLARGAASTSKPAPPKLPAAAPKTTNKPPAVTQSKPLAPLDRKTATSEKSPTSTAKKP